LGPLADAFGEPDDGLGLVAGWGKGRCELEHDAATYGSQAEASNRQAQIVTAVTNRQSHPGEP
jgi:hypothetical protein